MVKTSATLILCLLALQLSAQKYVGNEEDINKILHNIKKFSQHVMNSDYDSIALAYTEDGKIFPNNTDIIEGREKVRKRWVLPEGVKTTLHKLSPVEITINGEYAYDYGRYNGITQRKDGTNVPFKGKYVVVWKKVGEDWKIYLDIWNSIRD